MGDPDLLLLDEPTNGLDPAGIHEIRTLIRDLPNRRGVTIFLSSHLLAEVEQVATHFAIISEGELKFEGTAEELRIRNQPRIVAQVDDSERAHRLLTGFRIPATVERNRILIPAQSEYAPAQINAMLVREGLAVSSLTAEHLTLEDAFLDLTAPAPRKEPVLADAT